MCLVDVSQDRFGYTFCFRCVRLLRSFGEYNLFDILCSLRDKLKSISELFIRVILRICNGILAIYNCLHIFGNISCRSDSFFSACICDICLLLLGQRSNYGFNCLLRCRCDLCVSDLMRNIILITHVIGFAFVFRLVCLRCLERITRDLFVYFCCGRSQFRRQIFGSNTFCICERFCLWCNRRYRQFCILIELLCIKLIERNALCSECIIR